MLTRSGGGSGELPSMGFEQMGGGHIFAARQHSFMQLLLGGRYSPRCRNTEVNRTDTMLTLRRLISYDKLMVGVLIPYITSEENG